MKNETLLLAEFSKQVSREKPVKQSTLGDLARVLSRDMSQRPDDSEARRQAFANEFEVRVQKISNTPLKNISLQDLTIIVRTMEAMERTRHAKIRTWFSGFTVCLGLLGLMLYAIRVFLYY